MNYAKGIYSSSPDFLNNLLEVNIAVFLLSVSLPCNSEDSPIEIRLKTTLKDKVDRQP